MASAPRFLGVRMLLCLVIVTACRRVIFYRFSRFPSMFSLLFSIFATNNNNNPNYPTFYEKDLTF